jgi:hypothetical protein
VVGRVICVYVRVGRKCAEHLVCVVVMFDAAVVDGGLKWEWSGTRLRPGVNARDSRRELDFIRMRHPRSNSCTRRGNNWTVKMQLFAGLF